MSETIASRQVFSLYEVTRSIEKTIANRYQQSYWQKLREQQRIIEQLQTDLKRFSVYHLSTSKQKFSTLERDLETMHPKNVLRRGYSITTLNGKAVASVGSVAIGDKLENQVFVGVLILVR